MIVTTASLSLTAADLQRLRRFRINDQLIELHEIRRVSSNEARADCGIQFRGDLAGVAWPIWGADGAVKGYRVRRDNPEIEAGKPRAKYVQSHDRPHLFFEKSSRVHTSDANVPVVFVEAFSSALAIAAWAQRMGRRYLIIATLGCWSWRGTIGKTENENGTRVDEKGPSPDLDHVAFTNRDAIIFFDSNLNSNPAVQQACRAFAKELQRRGANVKVTLFPEESAINGPDDFLALRSDEDFAEILDAAVAVNPHEETLRELSRLSQIEYDQRREAAAKALGIRVSTLDSEVDKMRPAAGDGGLTSDGAMLLHEPEPWPHPVSGAELLDLIRCIFERYAILPPGAAVALSLWVLHTHLLDAADCSPVIAISSPEKKCGKTKVLEILLALCLKPLPTSNITAAALFRTVEKFQPTLLIDEADSFLSDNQELRGVLNSGHRKATAVIIRTTGETHEPKTFSTWCPKAIAVIGKLPGTLEDRSVVIPMRRKSRDETVERWVRHRDLAAATAELPRKAARFAADNLEALSHADPVTPDALDDRAADCWRPLLAIADRAGGEWPELARQAALTLSAGAEDSSVGTQLLADIRDIFGQHQVDRLASESIVEELAKLENRPWPEWKSGKAMSKSQLARQLGKFGIVSKSIRIGGSTPKGYEVSQFDDAFSRYLPNTGSQNATPPQPTLDKGFSPISNRNTDEAVAFSETPQPTPVLRCGGVAVSNPLNGDSETI